MNVLFICNQNQHRSRTAELLFRDKFNTRSAGLYNETPVTESEIKWADLIFVMEDFQREVLAERFPKIYMQKRIVSLGIPDEFFFNQPELIELLKKRVKQLMPKIIEATH